MNNINEYLTSIGYYKIINNEELFENTIMSLTKEQILKFACKINQLLRNKRYEDVITNGMIAGTLVAPSETIRDTILDNYIRTIKTIHDNKLRAELTYYTFINLHLFSDGNGRTSRLLYGLMANEIEHRDWYIHEDDSPHEYNGDFCTFKGLKDEEELNNEISLKLEDIVSSYRSKYPSLANKNIFKTYVTKVHGENPDLSEFISNLILSKLTEEEKQEIINILKDNGTNYSIGGLTMLTMSDKKGNLKEWIEKDNENTEKCLNAGYGYEWMRNRLCFSILKNKDLMRYWTIADWRELIQIGNLYKIEHFNRLNYTYLTRYLPKTNKSGTISIS